MRMYVLVAVGGALGSVARLWFSGFIANRIGGTFPWGTVLVNVSGSFAIGFFAALTASESRWPVGRSGRAFFMYGVCGGYTTFSSFSLQTLDLARDSDWLKAAGNVVVSVVLCLVAVWLGHVAAMAIRSWKGS